MSENDCIAVLGPPDSRKEGNSNRETMLKWGGETVFFDGERAVSIYGGSLEVDGRTVCRTGDSLAELVRLLGKPDVQTEAMPGETYLDYRRGGETAALLLILGRVNRIGIYKYENAAID